MCVHALYQVSSLYSHTYKVLQKKNTDQYMYMVSFSFSVKFISFFNRWFLYNVFLYGCLEYKQLYAWMSGMNNCIEIYYSIYYNFIILYFLFQCATLFQRFFLKCFTPTTVFKSFFIHVPCARLDHSSTSTRNRISSALSYPIPRNHTFPRSLFQYPTNKFVSLHHWRRCQ